MKMFDLSDKIALITGGSRGLGLQIAEGIIEAGGKVVLTARKVAELEEAQAHLQKMGGEAAIISCDLLDLDAIPAIATQAITAFGGLDILVNNAGTSWAAPMEDHSTAGWNKVMTLNVSAPFVLTREIGAQAFIPARAGKVLNIASIGGLGGNRADMDMFTVAYNTSKAALINFTSALATEWGRYNINVNALAPGFFPSKMSEQLLERIGDKTRAATPLGRLGGADDLKGPAIFMVSESARHITGQCLAVDGGATA
ncbi:MAG: SDR family oxidoreductase [Rhodobacteraceae bacterium]|nr:SDR family oxidoreductase [Paracoccaceae bacterium]MBL4810899.1 SDR family oxidoreductase [Paracoccaceae bacterium]